MGNDQAIQIYKETQEIVKKGSYQLPNGKTVKLDIDLEAIKKNKQVQNSDFYTTIQNQEQLQKNNTKILIINNDCLVTAQQLKKKYNVNPVVLNMANPERPGGGVDAGAMAQEENIFRRSNYFQHLCENDTKLINYPIAIAGAIYSPNVTIFRDEQKQIKNEMKYDLLEQPYKLSFIAAAALESPSLTQDFRFNQKDEQITFEKIKTILALAASENHDCVVLGAFGCGAFSNPPEHVAEIFKNAIEKNFKNVFKIIAFPIIFNEDNLKAFEKVFNMTAITVKDLK